MEQMTDTAKIQISAITDDKVLLDKKIPSFAYEKVGMV